MAAMLSRWLRPALFGALVLACACGDDDAPDPDAGPEDAAVADAAPDAPLPDGPRGDVLRVPESERWVLPTLEQPVYVLRTEAGVPHVYAATERDLRVVQGFLLARDRYFQIEAGRRLAQGTLSELMGDAALAADQASRGEGMRRVAERLVSLLTDEQREVYEACREGINAYVQAVKERRADPPSELRVAAPVLGARNAGMLMQPLSLEDVVAFAAVPVYQLGFESKDLRWAEVADEVATAFPDDALRRGGVQEDIFANVRPIHPVSSAAGFGLETDASGFLPDAFPSPGARPAALPGLRAARLPVERSMFARHLARVRAFERRVVGPRGDDFGSNAWAVMGDRTEDGATLLAGDGHLPLSIAPLFYQLGLDTSVFGEGETTLMGLFFAGIPPMAVGTNGRIAWSQTYLRGDVTDWYAEELVLDAEGAPRATRFMGEERPLVAVAETYEIADRPALGSVGRTETWTRWETFDGRPLTAIEGRVVTADATPGAGETLVNVGGEYVIPEDVDEDGVVSAISFDFAGFDVSNLLRALQGFNDADTVGDFREATRELVTYAQNLVAADVQGDVYYGSYNAIPSRVYLPRESEGGPWVEGADPRGLLDGTRFRGFTIPLGDDGLPDEGRCEGDEYQCLVPFEEWPAALSPARGFVLTANHDVANITTDGDFFDDPYYLGGPWNNGYRGATIQARLMELAEAGEASAEAMAALQGDHTSVLGLQFAPRLLEVIDRAQELAAGSPAPGAEGRLADLYAAHAARVDEVEARVRAWLERGAPAASGVETFYAAPSADERADAVATMLFNEWWRRLYRAVFDDEDMGFAFRPDAPTRITRALHDLWRGRGAANPAGLASWDAATEESAFFDDLGTEGTVESSDEVALGALVTALEHLESAPDPERPGVGGFGTASMEEWLWGLRHLVQFESIVSDFIGDEPSFALLASGFSITTETLPLAEGLEEDDPRATLPWFPRPGDLFNVDAAHWDYDADHYWYSDGPVMRMVIRLEEGAVSGVNILPGGHSGRTDSPHFADQAALWLGNETVPLRFHVEDVVAGATARETYAPE